MKYTNAILTCLLDDDDIDEAEFENAVGEDLCWDCAASADWLEPRSDCSSASLAFLWLL